jgi:hypothetical protein
MHTVHFQQEEELCDSSLGLSTALDHVFVNPIYMPPSRSGQCSLYIDWIWTGQPRGRSSIPGRVRNFLFSTLYRPAQGPTMPLGQ